MKRILNIIVLVSILVLPIHQEISAQSFSNLLSQQDIGKGLKEALDHGIKNQVSKLTAKDGFYKNDLVKIPLPGELQKVGKRLRRLGLGKLVDEGELLLNRAAEDAVKTATPIFVDAVKKMTFTDAKKILMGEQNAATNYLKDGTNETLYKDFNPVIRQSFQKVGADKVWAQIANKYNKLPFVRRINPDLVDYATQQALDGVFTMIAIEEKGIRQKIGLRDTKLLKKVFSLQDILKK
ncbi:MAG: hypothetical protein CMB99_06285 [Flavobacteriaceae bacterium]|nr:hypothetical protein [Flavobacteriaceae bacterium]|tara:strand:+ start:28721 stop:29431 length:711 start_codon:yes stop_codon:yes gene_type:complete